MAAPQSQLVKYEVEVPAGMGPGQPIGIQAHDGNTCAARSLALAAPAAAHHKSPPPRPRSRPRSAPTRARRYDATIPEGIGPGGRFQIEVSIPLEFCPTVAKPGATFAGRPDGAAAGAEWHVGDFLAAGAYGGVYLASCPAAPQLGTQAVKVVKIPRGNERELRQVRRPSAGCASRCRLCLSAVPALSRRLSRCLFRAPGPPLRGGSNAPEITQNTPQTPENRQPHHHLHACAAAA